MEGMDLSGEWRALWKERMGGSKHGLCGLKSEEARTLSKESGRSSGRWKERKGNELGGVITERSDVCGRKKEYNLVKRRSRSKGDEKVEARASDLGVRQLS